MTPEEVGMVFFTISLRDSDFEHVKSPEEMTEKIATAVIRGIQMAIQAEHERITKVAEQIEQGTYTTSRSVAQVLQAERVALQDRGAENTTKRASGQI